MKYVVIIIDGLSDDPIDALSNKTPLELAFIPNIHYIATKGKVGRIKTAYKGFPVESMTCIMGLLGYEPYKYYPNGRASFEAMAKGISIGKKDVAFRCNIVNVDKNKNCITDFTAGMISDGEARKIISKTKLPFENWQLYPGQSYRNILIIKNPDVNVSKIKCFPPHMHINEDLQKIQSYGEDNKANKLMKQVNKFIYNSYNEENKYMLWVWSPSKYANWPSFEEVSGLKGAVVCGLDFLQGIAMAANMDFDIIPGATGYTDTNYNKKAEYAIKYLENHNFVLVHINATDEEAHQRNYMGKIDAIEKIDRLIVGPILQELYSKYGNDFRIVICGDHKTRCSDGKHIGDPVPFAMYGKNIENTNELGFGERICNKYEPIVSTKFIKDNLIAI